MNIYVKDGRLCRMVDITNRVYIPLPEFSINASPNPLVLRSGYNKTVASDNHSHVG